MTEPSAILIATLTCADASEAERIGRVLVEERLAACVNFRPHTAIYRWEGKVEQSAETGMLIKTTRAAWPALAARVRELHSYETPVLLAWAPEAGLPDTLEWIAASVGAA